jgi:hypothetical protein
LVVRSETQVDEEVLQAAPRLRVVARAGVGVDNIDLGAATRAGVLVLNAPGANAVSAAEHTIALLLAVTRQIPFADASTKAGRWERKRMTPVDLRGRTVGVVGLGRVGSRVAQRLRAFEMKVIAYDPYISAARFTEIGACPGRLPDPAGEQRRRHLPRARPPPKPPTCWTPARWRCSNRARSSSTPPGARWSTRTRWPRSSAPAGSPAPASTSSLQSRVPTAPSSRCRTSPSPPTPAAPAPRPSPPSAK